MQGFWIGRSWYRTTIIFFYPGILGSIFYTVFHYLLVENHLFSTSALSYLACLFLGIIYYVDYQYTVASGSRRDRYHIGLAAIDFFVVVMAFFAVNLSLNAQAFDHWPIISIAGVMLAKKALAFTWEVARLDAENSPAQVLYALFGLLYAFAYFADQSFFVVTIILGFDAAVSLLWPFIQKNWPEIPKNEPYFGWRR